MLIVRRTIQSSLFKEFVNATFENVQSITQFVQTIGQIATQSLKTKLLRQIKNNTMPKKQRRCAKKGRAKREGIIHRAEDENG